MARSKDIEIAGKPKARTNKNIPAGNCAIYARYSSHSQKDASIEQQVEAAKAHAAKIGLVVVEVYADRAITGKTDKRPQFQRMLRDAEKGKFQYVIAWKSNRIGRNMLQAMVNEARLNDWGIRCLYTEEDFDDTAAGRFALRSMMNVNQFYVENMAEDIRRGLRDNAMNCKVNGLPGLGFKKGEDGKFALDPPYDAIVREIFTRAACRESFADIMRDLNERGIKTSKGGEWNKNSFHRLLRNERYRGVYTYGDVRIEGGVPRIVSDEVFYKVQEVLKVKQEAKGRHRPAGDYLLTGKLFCGHCNAPMTGICGTGKSGNIHYYYTCRSRRENKDCNKENVRRDEIEAAVASAIREYALSDEVVEWITDRTMAYNKRVEEENHVAILENELAATKKAIGNIMVAIEQGVITESTKERLLNLEAEQARLSAKLAAQRAEVMVVPREYIKAGLEMFRDGDVNDKKYQAKLFDTFLVSVYVYDDHLKIVLGFTGEKNTVTVPLDKDTIEQINSGPEERCSFKLSNSPLRFKKVAEAAFLRFGVCDLQVMARPYERRQRRGSTAKKQWGRAQMGVARGLSALQPTILRV